MLLKHSNTAQRPMERKQAARSDKERIKTLCGLLNINLVFFSQARATPASFTQEHDASDILKCPPEIEFTQHYMNILQRFLRR